jgi:hypothetical protein
VNDVPLLMYNGNGLCAERAVPMETSAIRARVLVETCSGDDVAQACEAMIKDGNWQQALQTWGDGLCCCLHWQLKVGGGRLGEQDQTVRVLKNVHMRNVCYSSLIQTCLVVVCVFLQ